MQTESKPTKKHVRSRGAVQLAQVGETQGQIAAKVKCSQVEVSYFQTGRRKPGPVNRTKFKKHYGISETAWDEKPVAPQANASSTAVDDSIDARIGRLQRTIDVFQETALSDESMTTRERISVLRDAIDAVRELSKITGESQEISEAKLVKLPVFRRVVDALVTALEPWPEAMKAAADALRSELVA